MLYQAMSALDKKTKAERALKDLEKVQGEQQVLFHIDWHFEFASICFLLCCFYF